MSDCNQDVKNKTVQTNSYVGVVWIGQERTSQV